MNDPNTGYARVLSVWSVLSQFIIKGLIISLGLLACLSPKIYGFKLGRKYQCSKALKCSKYLKIYNKKKVKRPPNLAIY